MNSSYLAVNPLLPAKKFRPRGRPFKKGTSGNSLGRPRIVEEFRIRARRAVDEKVIDAWINEVQEKGENWMKAAEILAAYGYGKPALFIEHSSASAEPPNIVVRFVGPDGGPIETTKRLQ